MRSPLLLCTALVGLTAWPAHAQYRYRILNEPVDAPRAMDTRTLAYTEPAQVMEAEGLDDGTGLEQWAPEPQANWTATPNPEPPPPGPQPDPADPYAPQFKHTLPWPAVLDERPAGPPPVPERAAAAPAPSLPASSVLSAPVPTVPEPPQPAVLMFPDESAGFDLGPDPVVEPPPAETELAWAPQPGGLPGEPVYWEIAVVVDDQTRGYAVVPLDAQQRPVLTVQALEALRLPVPASAVRSGAAVPEDLAQTYSHTFDPGTATLAFQSLTPPSLDEFDSEAPPLPSLEGGPTTTPRTTNPPSSDCVPRMRRGQSMEACP